MNSIYVVGDLIKNDGMKNLNKKFDTVKLKLEPLLYKHSCSPGQSVQRPTYPFHLDVLFKFKKKCKEFQ